MTTLRTLYVLRATKPGFGLGLTNPNTGAESRFRVSDFVTHDGPATRNVQNAALYPKRRIESWIEEYNHTVDDCSDNPNLYARFKSVEVVQRTDVYLNK